MDRGRAYQLGNISDHWIKHEAVGSHQCLRYVSAFELLQRGYAKAHSIGRAAEEGK